MDPSPVADHDPFSLGDSDDEDKVKDVGIQMEEKDNHSGMAEVGKGEGESVKKG